MELQLRSNYARTHGITPYKSFLAIQCILFFFGFHVQYKSIYDESFI